MELVVTQREPIYRGDNLSKKIIYLVPLTLGEIDPLTAYFYLSYIRADGIADVVVLERMEDKYNESYYQYTFPEFVSRKLTKFPGEICTWMQIYSGDPSDPIVAKSGECVLQVQESKNIDEYLCDHQVTAIYQLNKDIENVSSAVEAKADNIIFNADDNTIQLSANGEPIGDRIAISTYTGAVVTNAGITTDGELIVTFSDGTMKNLGNVVDENGAVYVPHISERKVLSFTIEDKPTGVPDPVDLNPFDEWSDMDGDVESEYIWEKM